jgi:DNA-binding PadR family transcriptional regulator
MSDDVLRHLFLGFIRLHVLYHAGKEPICGAELIEELRHHGYDIGPGTLYPMLHQMQKAGLIVSDDEVVEGKRRKNLTITSAGRKILAKARVQLKELAAEILEDRDARALRKHE